MPRKTLTLVLIRKPNEVLLGYKKRGFGSYKWNGFGGKVEENESICEAAIRELKEESGLVVSPNNLEQVGIINFEFVGDPIILEVHVFTSAIYDGQPFETEEMIPKWFKLQDIPFHEMWADDRLWFPLLLSGKKFQGMAADHNRFTNVFPESKRFKTATVRAKILDIKKLVNIGLDMSELRCKDLENIKCFRGPQPLDSSNIFYGTQSNGERYIVVKEPSYSPSPTAEWPSFRKLNNIRFPNENRQESLTIWYPANQTKSQQSKISVTNEKNTTISNFDCKREEPDMPETRTRFKPIVCDICNREFGSRSISIHRPQCMKKLMSSNNQRPTAFKS